MQDRFKFRIWNKKKGYYTDEYIDREIMLNTDGTLNAVASDFSNDRTIEDINKNDDFIVEQCTGTKDKNGKLVYEGDVIKTPNGSIGYIVWSQQDLGFSTKDLNPKEKEVYLFECEVIGNIHEYAEEMEKEI